jgi:hypothetical protein
MLVLWVTYGARRRKMGLGGVIEGRFMGEGIYLLLRFSPKVDGLAPGGAILWCAAEFVRLVPPEACPLA